MDNFFVKQGEDGFVILHITKYITDEEINLIIQRSLPEVLKANRGWCCAIAGYEHDKRELYEIPEAIALCERFCVHGLISILHPSTLLDREEIPSIRMYLGALEIWAIATDRFRPKTDKSDLELDENDMAEFLEVLNNANSIANNSLPKDGQNRTKVI